MKTYLKTIIIGGQGFIGINLVNLLLKYNRQITIVTKDNNNILLTHPNLIIIKNDCSDYLSLTNIFYKADEIINLAYNSVPKTSFDNPIKDIENNLLFTINIFRAAIKSKIKKIINISTGGAIYGIHKKFPLKEKYQTRPISPYAISKLTIENYSRLFNLINGLPIINLRPSNAYGIHQQPFTGQGIVATIITSIIQNKKFIIFGKDTIRDYLYISDLVQGIKITLDFGKIGKTYNLGTAKGTNNYTLLKKILKIANTYNFKSVNFEILATRAFDVPKNILDYQKINNDTGWKPKVILNKGLEKSWKWYIEQYKK
jgi:UDP-glucose 4-epimerase